MSTVADFMAAAPAPLSGNSPWAVRYAADLRRVVNEHAAHNPRTLQAHLGPSELGSICDRQVAGKLAGVPRTNHVVDPWPSIVGTAVHAWLADAFAADNARHGLRWVPEQRVVPHPDHPGTADLYDGEEQAVVDHKILGETAMAKVRSQDGPPLRYQVQLLLYGKGYRLLGLPVRRDDVDLDRHVELGERLRGGLHHRPVGVGPHHDADAGGVRHGCSLSSSAHSLSLPRSPRNHAAACRARSRQSSRSSP